jgi:hypothetical protein
MANLAVNGMVDRESNSWKLSDKGKKFLASLGKKPTKERNIEA